MGVIALIECDGIIDLRIYGYKIQNVVVGPEGGTRGYYGFGLLIHRWTITLIVVLPLSSDFQSSS